jgi:hypothetical protein
LCFRAVEHRFHRVLCEHLPHPMRMIRVPLVALFGPSGEARAGSAKRGIVDIASGLDQTSLRVHALVSCETLFDPTSATDFPLSDTRLFEWLHCGAHSGGAADAGAATSNAATAGCALNVAIDAGASIQQSRNCQNHKRQADGRSLVPRAHMDAAIYFRAAPSVDEEI